MALTVFGGLLMLVPTLFVAFTGLAFSPALFLAGFREEPVLFLSPLLGQLAQAGIFATVFNAIFLLIAGRFVERAVGGVGLVALFVAGLYVFRLIMPFDVHKEIEVDQNTALGIVMGSFIIGLAIIVAAAISG